jgi:hypothetical protein
MKMTATSLYWKKETPETFAMNFGIRHNSGKFIIYAEIWHYSV